MTEQSSATSPVGSSASPDGAPPLTQTTFYLLASLVDGPKHGYAISKDVEARSGSSVRLGVGNLYVALRRLLEQGLIERAADATAAGERRTTHRITKTYRITDRGSTVFRAETERQRRMMAANPLLRREGTGTSARETLPLWVGEEDGASRGRVRPAAWPTEGLPRGLGDDGPQHTRGAGGQPLGLAPPQAANAARQRNSIMKLVDSLHYHLWTDALHGRALARQAANEWDRGTYVRWTVGSAWTAFEAACADALDATGLGYRFKERLDEAVTKNRLSPINWGHGIWQQTLTIYKMRIDYVHVRPAVDQGRLFAPVQEADAAIAILREAIRAVYTLATKSAPPWVKDDDDPGWPTRSRVYAYGTYIHGGADKEDPNVIRIAYVDERGEHVSEIAPPGADHIALIDQAIKNSTIPIGAVRAYRGDELIVERELPVRGSITRPR